MLSKTNAYAKHYCDETLSLLQTKWMYFLIEGGDLLKKYNSIWDKVSVDIKKKFDRELAYNKKLLKTKIKSHGVELTDFYE